MSPDLAAALAAYVAEWIRVENERGEYVREIDRHIRAMEAALKAAYAAKVDAS
jgi:hypothetical protein